MYSRAATIVFFAAYFLAWVVGELPHTLFVTVSAIAAIVIAVLMVLDVDRVYVRR